MALLDSTWPCGRFDLCLCRQSCLFDVGLLRAHIGFDCGQCRFGVVQILMRSGLLIHQRLQSFDIHSRFDQIGFGLGEIRLRLQKTYLAGRELLVGNALRQITFRFRTSAS